MSKTVIRRSVYLTGVIGLASLVWGAVQAGRDDPASTPWLIASDVIVGLAFLFAASLAPGSVEMRTLVAAVGVSWLIGSWLPGAALVHLSVLAGALTIFPRGRPAKRFHWALIVISFPIALGLIPQIGVALLLAAIGAVLLMTVPDGGARYPATAAAAVALVLGGSWAYSRMDPVGFDQLLALLLYETVLVAVAIAFPFAVRSRMAEGAKLTNLVLSDDGRAGLDGLASLLAEALEDPGLRLYRWNGEGSRDPTDEALPSIADDPTRRWLLAKGVSGEPIAAVYHKSLALEDPSIREAVVTAVQLAVQNQLLQEDLQAKLNDLEAAGARLVAAVDRQRLATATRLREDVGTSLHKAMGALETVVEDLEESEAAGVLAVVIDELARAEDEVQSMVAGVLPNGTGRGHLADFIADLARRSPVPVTVNAPDDLATDPDTEAALFYVCSEALTNAAKHSRARAIGITLANDGRSLILRVADDGSGGADPSGSGLQGLSDRLAARGGRLHVESPPGAGTILTATLPL